MRMSPAHFRTDGPTMRTGRSLFPVTAATPSDAEAISSVNTAITAAKAHTAVEAGTVRD